MWRSGLEVQSINTQVVQGGALKQREVIRVGAVQLHRLLKYHGWVAHESRDASDVVRRGVQHERMDDHHVTGLASHFLKARALGDQLLKFEVTRRNAFRMISEVARNQAHRVWGDKRPAALMPHVRPHHDWQQRLFAAIQKMTEIAAVLVPAGDLGRWRLPGLTRATVEVDDEGIRPNP